MADGDISTRAEAQSLAGVEREETTFGEVVRRIREGTFYDDYDWASGPALRALDRAETAMQDFVDKVDRGEARSKRSYAAFTAVLRGPTA